MQHRHNRCPQPSNQRHPAEIGVTKPSHKPKREEEPTQLTESQQPGINTGSDFTIRQRTDKRKHDGEQRSQSKCRRLDRKIGEGLAKEVNTSTREEAVAENRSKQMVELILTFGTTDGEAATLAPLNG